MLENTEQIYDYNHEYQPIGQYLFIPMGLYIYFLANYIC